MTQRSEAVRGLVRILSNYARLFSTFLIGLIFVRVALRFGNDAFGLIGLLGVSAGLMSMISEVVTASMIRELGAAYHSKDPRRFREVYSSAYVVCLGAAIVTLLCFGTLVPLLPWLQIDAELLTAARWFVALSALYSFTLIVVSPASNMYMITERMVAVNLFGVTIRILDLVAAVAALYVAEGAAGRVIAYGVITNVLGTLQLLAISGWIMARDHNLIPRWRCISSFAIRQLIFVSGWNSAVVVAMSLGSRTDAIIMNKWFGLDGNVLFGISLQLSNYVRMIAMGMTSGLDAVATRISSVSDTDAIRRLLNYTTRMHGWVAFPAGLGFLFLVEPFLHIWLGNRIADPARQIPGIAAITRVLLIGVTIRSISDGWTKVLYGAGMIRAYAPLIFIGSLFNPFLCVLLLYVFPTLITGPAWMHSAVFFVVHLVLLPLLLRQSLRIGLRDTVFPLVRPAVTALLCSPILIWGQSNLQPGDLGGLLLNVSCFAIAFLALSCLLVINAEERRRVVGVLRRMLLKRARL